MPARQMFSGVMQHCKSLFLREFQEVRECSPDLEARLASVPGLLTSLFEHVSEMKQKRRKKNKVRFSALAEIFPDREEEEGPGMESEGGSSTRSRSRVVRFNVSDEEN